MRKSCRSRKVPKNVFTSTNSILFQPKSSLPKFVTSLKAKCCQKSLNYYQVNAHQRVCIYLQPRVVVRLDPSGLWDTEIQLAVSTKEQKKKTTEKRVYLQSQRSPAPTVKRFDGADFQGNQLVRHDLECGYNCGATTSNNCNRSCRFRQHLASVLECSFNFVSTEAYKSYVLSNSTMFIPRVLVRQRRWMEPTRFQSSSQVV